MEDGRCHIIFFFFLGNLDGKNLTDAIETVGRLIQNVKKNADKRRSEEKIK